MLKEFKDFAVKGNMLDMAIGIMIGAAFGTVVKSLVDDILMPIVGKVTGGIDFSQLAIDIGGVNIRYGSFVNALISFLIIAFVLFLIVKNVNRFKKAEEEKPSAPPADVALLTEIRDLLQKQNG